MIKIKIIGHLDPTWKDWFDGFDIITEGDNSPQSPAIYPISVSIDNRYLLFNTKNKYMTQTTDTFGERIKKQ